MRASRWFAVLTAILVVDVGCGRPEEPSRGSNTAGTTSAAEAQRTITVTKGDTLHVESGPGGGATITVIVQAGKEGAGSYSYSSSSPHLRKAADDAARTLADPNTVTKIGVDGSGALVSISSTVTKR